MSESGAEVTEIQKIASNVASVAIPAIDPSFKYRIIMTDIQRNIFYFEFEKVFKGQETVDEMLSIMSQEMTKKEQELMK